MVYDGIGAATFDESLASLRPRGYMVLYGAASGQPPPSRSPAQRRLAVPHAPDARPLRPRGRRAALRAADVFGWIAAGELDVRIGGRYPLAHAARAQEDLAARGTTGKLILTP